MEHVPQRIHRPRWYIAIQFQNVFLIRRLNASPRNYMYTENNKQIDPEKGVSCPLKTNCTNQRKSSGQGGGEVAGQLMMDFYVPSIAGAHQQKITVNKNVKTTTNSHNTKKEYKKIIEEGGGVIFIFLNFFLIIKM